MSEKITARQVLNRIQMTLGASWRNSGTDVFHAGNPETEVTGIVTTFAPTLDVLRRAVAGGKNMIISRESPFWIREAVYSGSGQPANREQVAKNPTYLFKKEYIEQKNLVIWQFHENWGGRKVDGQLRGLAMALGWDRYHKTAAKAGEERYQAGDCFFGPPATSLQALAKSIQDKLKIRGIRVIGNPQTKIGKVALSHGFFLVPDLQRILREPGVDAVVIGEPVEWEASPYFMDVIASGQKKGLIVLGNEVSEEPGSGEVAAWLKTFVSEVPVEWISAGEPFWSPKPA